MNPHQLLSQEYFCCAACSGPGHYLPPFLTLDEVRLHSLQYHRVEHKVKTQIDEESQNSQMFFPRPTLRLKPLDLLLDPKKFKSIDSMASGSLKGGMMKTPEEVNPKKVKLLGIKKGVTEDCIVHFFSKNGVEIVQASISNGSGFVIFKNVMESEAWYRKVIQIRDCSIQICHAKVYSECVGEKNILKMRGNAKNVFAKNVSLDDLHNFFWKERCVIDEIDITSNSCGFVHFRLREDAADWAGKVIIVNSAKIKLFKAVAKESSGGRSEMGNKLGRKRTRSWEEERSRGDSDREDGWRHRSGERSTRDRGKLLRI
eukprot:GFUD01127703.1.p1 GENE.GFUD01127703.1~~GFUD01127703.1.p1  ORF type:complete len:315 (-),score=69.75 GFUD01127703.1:111-1055(-)